MNKILGLVVACSLVCAFACAQDSTTVRKPASTVKSTKVEGAGKVMKEDCCTESTVKAQAEGCAGGCGECMGETKSTGKAKPSEAHKARTPKPAKAK